MPHKVQRPKLHGLKEGEVQKDRVNVHHITPGRADKNFGKAINSIIAGLPDNDWICLRDIDTIPMYHEKFFEQCETIANAGEFDLVGAFCNRLGLHYQLHEGKKSDERDIMVHRQIAKERFEKYGSTVQQIKQNIAGLFMLFPKSVWKEVGGFPEGGIMINGSFLDFHFSNAVKKKRKKIGLALGIYLFHFYRFDVKEGENPKAHLI
jgi:GT2 family glycosyltransferase